MNDDDIDVTHNVRRWVRHSLFRIEKERLRYVAPFPSPRMHRLLQVRGGSDRPSDLLAGLRRTGRAVRLDGPGPRDRR
jgi:hypothetical protein